MHGIQRIQKIRPVRDEIIITAMKFVTYLTALFELRNTNFLPILSPYGTFNCKLLLSRNRALVLSWFEAWRKRRYPKSFVAKLTEAEAETAETQVWLDYALACNYINLAEYKPLYEKYEHIVAMLIAIYTNPDKWKL